MQPVSCFQVLTIRTSAYSRTELGSDVRNKSYINSRKLPYYGHTMRKQGSLPGERMQGTASCTQARKAMHGLDGQHMDRTPRGRVGENNRTEINGESSSWYWPTLVSRTAKEQNILSDTTASSTDCVHSLTHQGAAPDRGRSPISTTASFSLLFSPRQECHVSRSACL